MNENDSVIHLRVPAHKKGSWIRASRAAGKKLSDWIVASVEATSSIAIDKFAEAVQEALNEQLRHFKIDRAERSVSSDNKVDISLYGEDTHKVVIKNGVIGIYKNSELIGACFDCDHVYTDDPKIVANFILQLCGFHEE